MMSTIILLHFVIFNALISSTRTVDVKIIKSYMELKSLNYATIIGCFDKKDMLNIAKMFENVCHLQLITAESEKFELALPNRFHGGIILFVDCENIQEFLKRCGEANMYGLKHHWLIIARGKSNIMNVYNPGFYNGGEFRKKIIGKYNDKNGFQLIPIGLKYTNRRNMSEVKLRATITLPVNFSLPLSEYLVYDAQREINTFNRFHCKLIFFCQDYYNFSMENIQVTESWGYLLPNNSFDGLVGQLERNQTDISLSCLFFRSDRLEKIDFGTRTWIMKVAFIFRNPKVPASFTVFLKPLSSSIWLTTLIIFAISILLYKFINESENKIAKNGSIASWSELLLFIFGTFCQQGTTLNSNFLCGRIVILFAFVLSLLIYQFYSASIVSILLMKPPTPIKTPEDLLNSQMECRSENILYNIDYFKRAIDKISSDIFRHKLKGDEGFDYFLSPQEGLKLVSRGGYAFNVELATAYPIIDKTFQEDIICELKEVQLMRALQMFSSFQKGSSFRKSISVRLQRLAEVGILDREKKHWLPRKPVCLNKLNSSKFTVGLRDLYPAFVMLSVGLVTTYIIYLIEKGFEKYIFISSESEYPFAN
ncbi:glutamate receptor ionotropic, delta-1-like isoform X3 [Coccinella septempunctata]|uniref:glutamate receptor ionotropic, delta-1-like isoform X3 n=2 Tax=Coccinella septempunctata TaxID=41139 RepID=UPI001D06BF0B|nr:glutamate receptor ionotropic, delta-1-like isoform X3 [Coccinella septempunctata]